jgi:Protein of unknown function (DUF1559)
MEGTPLASTTNAEAAMMRRRSEALFGLALLAAFAALPAAGRAEEIDPEPPGIWPRTVAAHRGLSAKNLQQIGLAVHNFHDTFGAMPANAIRDKAGKPLLSWRVALLPYLDEHNLYKEFRLDEPWDSKHNKALLAKMPKVYAPTITGKPAKPNTTYYWSVNLRLSGRACVVSGGRRPR